MGKEVSLMPTCRREALCAYIAETALMRINGADPYTNTLVKVYRTAQDPDMLGAETPAICMVEGERTPDPKNEHNKLKGFWMLPLTLVLWVRNDNSSLEPATVINNWEADCDLAMRGGNANGNGQHGGKAIHTDPLGSDLLQLDPHYAAWIGGEINYSLHYSQQWADPTLT
jgi:hypothetical protein